MPRAVDGTLRKDHRKKILKQAKGFWGRRSKLHRTAKDAVAKAGQYAYRDRKNKKRIYIPYGRNIFLSPEKMTKSHINDLELKKIPESGEEVFLYEISV